MRKFFILTLMVACLMMVSCVERRNRVILDKFIPIPDNCEIKPGGDTYYTEGKIDLAFTFDYKLAFQLTNYIPSSDGGNSELTTAEANYFYAEKVEIEYEWYPYKQETTGAQLKLNQKLWNKKTRNTEHRIVVGPDGGQAAGWVHIFEEAQILNLLENDVNNYDWIANPLIIKVRVIGELADGTTVKTNKMNFNIIPTFGTTIQQGSTYYIPEGGFQAETDENGKETKSAEKVEYETIKGMCAFSDPILGGCLYGQDDAMVNCYAGDTAWEQYIVESNGWTYIPGYAAYGVVEMIYNTYKKPANDNGYYACCPSQEPPEPEDKEDDDASNAANGGATGGE
ncbi:hypothetical protein IKS86_04740 [bacterium]|nr:hypothetical protein [bacterium]